MCTLADLYKYLMNRRTHSFLAHKIKLQKITPYRPEVCFEFSVCVCACVSERGREREIGSSTTHTRSNFLKSGKKIYTLLKRQLDFPQHLFGLKKLHQYRHMDYKLEKVH